MNDLVGKYLLFNLSNFSRAITLFFFLFVCFFFFLSKSGLDSTKKKVANFSLVPPILGHLFTSSICIYMMMLNHEIYASGPSCSNNG